ncbi:MAG: hypothetical protein LUQ65_08900 [Candidatus Helarchaeota archaeon]|nr:hypothetical protein [Candidatus Helarchaeota archaeon]
MSNWGKDPKFNGLILFAQSLDEGLFHFTIDSYKPPLYNVHGILNELYNRLIKSNQLKLNISSIKKNIKPICDEFSYKLSKDETAQNLLKEIYGEQGLKLIQYNIHNWTSLEDYFVFIDSLNELFDETYLENLKKELVETVDQATDFEKIINLSRLFISELSLKGFSREYMYHTTISYFFKDNKFLNTGDIKQYVKDYFSLYPDEKIKYDVIFRVSDEFKFISEYFKIESSKPGLKKNFYTETPEPRSDDRFEKLFLTGKYEGLEPKYRYFLEVKEVNAFDPYSAREDAKFELGFLNNFIAYSTYYINLKWDSISLVYSAGKPPYVTERSVSPLAKNKKFDYYYQESIKKIPSLDLSKVCEKKESVVFVDLEASGYSLFKSLSLHRSAIDAVNTENQFLNVWIGLETLLPIEKMFRKYSAFSETYLPLLNRRYVNKLINEFLSNLDFLLGGRLDEFFSGFPIQFNDRTNFEKCSMLIAVRDDTVNLTELAIRKIGRNPLLIYRLKELHEQLSCGEAILTTIDNHNRRVLWHIERLYRARNFLMHQGERMGDLDGLLENLNFYYHTILDLIEEVAIQYEHITSLESVYNWVNIEHLAHRKFLESNKGTYINYDNYNSMLFGNLKLNQ